LLPEPHNTKLLTLLYRLAEWHALAKLRMHTDHTLGHLEKATTLIGQELRFFRDWTHKAFTCKELPSEYSRRQKKNQKRGKKDSQKNKENKNKTIQKASAKNAAESSSKSDTLPRIKIFNMLTPKLHALGDYVQTIRLFGTTDSYSTQIVCVHGPLNLYLLLTII
jgi:hypothetical protein